MFDDRLQTVQRTKIIKVSLFKQILNKVINILLPDCINLVVLIQIKMPEICRFYGIVIQIK